LSPGDGYFPRSSSVLRRVHEQRAVGLLYGQRALAIGAVNPLNFIGTRNHTWAQATPFKRLSHTALLFETIFFGSRAEADEVLAFVEHQHQPVHGELAEDAGEVKAGTPYSAFDPELMLWTVAVSAESALTFYELLVGKLSEPERDRFWADYVRFGDLFGMPREVAPRSHAEFREYFEHQLTRPEAHLTAEARYVGSAVMFEIPVPASRRPAMRIHNLLMVGSLPPVVREMYGLNWSAAKAAGFRATVAALRGARPLTPRRIRSGRNTASFDLVAETERSWIERGDIVPGSLPEGVELSEVLAG
jgi:uncharacterized protein (DUF2236 family)